DLDLGRAHAGSLRRGRASANKHQRCGSHGRHEASNHLTSSPSLLKIVGTQTYHTTSTLLNASITARVRVYSLAAQAGPCDAARAISPSRPARVSGAVMCGLWLASISKWRQDGARRAS